jgi:hypothetical protein
METSAPKKEEKKEEIKSSPYDDVIQRTREQYAARDLEIEQARQKAAKQKADQQLKYWQMPFFSLICFAFYAFISFMSCACFFMSCANSREKKAKDDEKKAKDDAHEKALNAIDARVQSILRVFDTGFPSNSHGTCMYP